MVECNARVQSPICKETTRSHSRVLRNHRHLLRHHCLFCPLIHIGLLEFFFYFKSCTYAEIWGKEYFTNYSHQKRIPVTSTQGKLSFQGVGLLTNILGCSLLGSWSLQNIKHISKQTPPLPGMTRLRWPLDSLQWRQSPAIVALRNVSAFRGIHCSS